MVLTKSEQVKVDSKGNSSYVKRQRECCNYIVETTDRGVDITPGLPFRHEFTLILDPIDYVPSVWYCYSPSRIVQYDWELQIIFRSTDKTRVETENGILVCRCFPLVLVE